MKMEITNLTRYNEKRQKISSDQKTVGRAKRLLKNKLQTENYTI